MAGLDSSCFFFLSADFFLAEAVAADSAPLGSRMRLREDQAGEAGVTTVSSFSAYQRKKNFAARVCRPLFRLCRPFMIFEGCLASTQSAAVASWRATDLTNHPSKKINIIFHSSSNSRLWDNTGSTSDTHPSLFLRIRNQQLHL